MAHYSDPLNWILDVQIKTILFSSFHPKSKLFYYKGRMRVEGGTEDFAGDLVKQQYQFLPAVFPPLLPFETIQSTSQTVH